jgi:type VI secretion system protein ImpF
VNLPSLLDRLTDDEPGERHEAPERRAMSLERLRESVRRDLTWLFNSVGIEAVRDLSRHEEIARSTLNFGIPDVTGRAVSTIDRVALAGRLRRAIWDFEPRLIRSTVSVRPVTTSGRHGPTMLSFAIEAELWAEPTPLHLLLRTELNLESGDARVTEQRTE